MVNIGKIVGDAISSVAKQIDNTSTDVISQLKRQELARTNAKRLNTNSLSRTLPKKDIAKAAESSVVNRPRSNALRDKPFTPLEPINSNISAPDANDVSWNRLQQIELPAIIVDPPFNIVNFRIDNAVRDNLKNFLDRRLLTQGNLKNSMQEASESVENLKRQWKEVDKIDDAPTKRKILTELIEAENTLKRVQTEAEDYARKRGFRVKRGEFTALNVEDISFKAAVRAQLILRAAQLENMWVATRSLVNRATIGKYTKSFGLILIGTALVSTIIVLAIERTKYYQETKFEIEKISMDENKKVFVEFKEEVDDINQSDLIEIIESNGTPNMVGRYEIADVESRRKVQLKTDKEIVGVATQGKFQLLTTIPNQVQNGIVDALKNSPTATAGSAGSAGTAGTVEGETAQDPPAQGKVEIRGASDSFDDALAKPDDALTSFFKSLGIDIGAVGGSVGVIIISIICCLLCCSSFMALVIATSVN